MKEKLNNKSISELITMITNTNPIDSCNAICEVVKRRIKSLEVIVALKKQKENSKAFWNTYNVSDFCTAALDLLNVEKYEGDRYEIKRLIESKLDF